MGHEPPSIALQDPAPHPSELVEADHDDTFHPSSPAAITAHEIRHRLLSRIQRQRENFGNNLEDYEDDDGVNL